MKLSKINVALIALTIIGAIIRFYHLGWNSLWLDEAATLWYSSSGYAGVWKYVLSGEYNPPLFYWIETLMLNFGRSEIVLRLIPCIAGVATIPTVYYLGKEWRGSTIGFAAAALTTFCPMLVYYSQEARAYSLVVLFVVLMLWSYLKALKTNEYKWWIITAAFGALAFWTHFYSFMVVSAIFLYAIWNAFGNKDELKRVLVSGIAFVWMILPIALATWYLLKLRTDEAPTFGIQGPGILSDLFWNFGNYSQVISIIFFVLFVAGLIILYRTERPKAIFVGFIFTYILILTVFASYRIPMVSRYMLFLIPLYFMIIAEPLTYLKDRKIQTLAVVAACVLSAGPLWSMHTQYSKDDWRGFMGFVSERTHDGDVIIFSPAYMDLPGGYYYSNTTDKTTIYKASNITELEWYTQPGKTWFIMTPDVGAVPSARPIPAWLENNTTFVTKWTHYLYLFHG